MEAIQSKEVIPVAEEDATIHMAAIEASEVKEADTKRSALRSSASTYQVGDLGHPPYVQTYQRSYNSMCSDVLGRVRMCSDVLRCGYKKLSFQHKTLYFFT